MTNQTGDSGKYIEIKLRNQPQNITQGDKIMKIERLILKNYRQYRNQNIEFISKEASKNFFIVVGESGSGKTNLLNSITWCLYEEEPHLSKGSEQLPILNLGAVEESAENDVHETSVEVHLFAGDKSRFIFSRSQKFRVKDVGRSKPPTILSMGDSSLKLIKETPGKDPKILEEPAYDVQGDIERFIPSSIKEYYFFDGERIDRYFRETRKVREPIYRLSRVDLLDKVYDHLDKTLADFIEEAKLPPEIEETRKEIKNLKRDIDELNKFLYKITEEKAIAEANEEEAHNKLKEKEFLKHLTKEQDRLNKEIDGMDKSLKDMEGEKIEYLLEIARTVFPLKAINKTLAIIKEKRDRKEIPITMDRNFIKELLDKKECICSRDLPEGSKERALIKDVFNHLSILSDVHEELLYTEFELGRLKKAIASFKKNHSRINERIISQEEKRDDYSKLLKETEVKLVGHEDVDVAELEKNYLKWKTVKEELISKNSLYNAQLTGKKSELESKNKQLDAELKKQKKYEQLTLIKKFCERGLSICDDAKEEIMLDIKKDIEEKTKTEFFKLIWRKDTYKDVKIDDNYDIHVFHKMGYEGLGTVSAGEREALALAFIGAVHIVSGFEAPMVMDTPLARMSGTPRRYIAENLPNYLENEQIILLMTDQEYTKEVKNRLETRTAKEYELKLGTNENEIEVV